MEILLFLKFEGATVDYKTKQFIQAVFMIQIILFLPFQKALKHDFAFRAAG
jgi:hypothetical protein